MTGSRQARFFRAAIDGRFALEASGFKYGLEKRMRDIKVLQVLGGTNSGLLVRHMADNL